MRKTMILVKKDLYFNQRMYICIYIAVVLLMLFSSLGIEDNDATPTLNYLVYTCLSSMVIVPYSFNKDDDLSTRNFIMTLPITLDEILWAKWLLSLVASVLLSFSGLVIFNYFGDPILYRCTLIPMITGVLFTSVFLPVYYKFDLHVAGFTVMAPVVLFAFLAKNLEKNWRVDGELFEVKLLLAVTTVTFVLSVFMIKITKKLIERKKYD